MKKIFGEINLTWTKTIIFAVIAGVYTAIMAMIPMAKDTSFSDLTVSFEVWILCGIFIIMNSKSAKDSALKCFVFFLISQPLVYLIQDAINHSRLFVTYYRYWFMWTIATIPMGFIGYYMKKDKWWGLLILAPILILLGIHFANYLGKTIFSFPRHILTTVFCFATLIIYPIAIFKDKKNKITGIIISVIIILFMTGCVFLKPSTYKTTLFTNGEEHNFDNTYKAYLTDESFGKIYIVYEENIEDYMLNAEFKKAGKTEFILESPDGKKEIYEIDIKRNTYSINKK